MKKAIALTVTAALALSLTACKKPDNTKSPEGEEIFVCDPDNMFGFAGVYVEEDLLSIQFDRDYTYDGMIPRGMEYFFDHPDLGSSAVLYVVTDDESIRIDFDDVNINDRAMTIRFDVSDIDVDEINGFTFSNGDQFAIMFDDGELSAVIWGGDCANTYRQHYDEGRDEWSDIEEDFRSYPETIIDDPGVQPDDLPAYAVTGEFIVPYLAEYYPDEFVPENNEYVYGMVDLDGNIVYEPRFSSVQYIEDCNVYIVRGESDGQPKYGLMRGDGSVFTGLNFDGAYYDPDDFENAYGEFLMSNYNDGILHVTHYDNDVMILHDDTDITIDESVLPYTGAPALGVRHICGNGALITDCNEFYRHSVIIDITTGQLLHDFDQPYGGEFVFGNAVILNNTISGGVYIYDFNGECIFEDDDATGLKLSDYEYAVASGNTLEVFTRAGFSGDEITISSNAQVDMVGGLIAVSSGDTTTFYDEELDVVYETDYINLDRGYMPGRYTGNPADIFFVSYDEDTITNILTGDSMDTVTGYYYSNYGDYIFAENRGDGNAEVHDWYLYDSNLNLIFTDEGYASVYEDEFTGGHYLIASNNDVTSVYSVESEELMFTIDGNFAHYTVSIYDGVFYLTDGSTCYLINSAGETLFSYDYA